MLGLTILLSETIELLRNSNGLVTRLIRRCISWCCEFRAHKEQTQSIHQTVIGVLCYTDRVEIWYPTCLREWEGTIPGTCAQSPGLCPLGQALDDTIQANGVSTGFRQTAFPSRYFSITRGGKSYMKRK